MSNHTYFCKETGLEYPSVTTILGIISKGEGFNNWLKKQGDKADTLLNDAASFGTNVHNHLESIGKGVTVNLEALKPQEKRCVKAFIEWKDKNVKRFVTTEQSVFNVKEGYAGTLDSVIEDNNGKIILVDYKTSGNIYDTYSLQCASYAKAYELTTGTNIDGAVILRFEKDENKKKDMQEKEVLDLNYSYEVFLAAKKVWDWKNKGK